MGLVSLFRKSKVKNSKWRVGGLLASTIEHVIAAQGVGALLSGTLHLNKELQPGFSGGPVSKNEGYLAVVAIVDLEGVAFLKMFADLGGVVPVPSSTVDDLARSAMYKFSAQSQEFSSLPDGGPLGT